MMRFCGIAQIGETQFGFSFGQGDAVKTVRIGGCSLILMTLNDVGSNQRLGRRPISDISADSELAAYSFWFFFLLQKDMPAGELITDLLIFERKVKYLKRSWNIIFILVWFSSDNNLFIVLWVVEITGIM